MKDYIYQFYNEGLGTTFYLKPVKFINKFIKNKAICKIIEVIIKIFYTILVIVLAYIMFLDRYPL